MIINKQDFSNYTLILGKHDFSKPLVTLQYRKKILKEYLTTLKSFTDSLTIKPTIREILEFIFCEDVFIKIDTIIDFSDFRYSTGKSVNLEVDSYKGFHFTYSEGLYSKLEDLKDFLPHFLSTFNSVFNKQYSENTLMQFICSNDQIITLSKLFLIFNSMYIDVTLEKMMQLDNYFKKFKSEFISYFFTYKLFAKYKNYAMANNMRFPDKTKVNFNFTYNFIRFNENLEIDLLPEYVLSDNEFITTTIHDKKIIVNTNETDSLKLLLLCNKDSIPSMNIINIIRSIYVQDFLKHDEKFLLNLKELFEHEKKFYNNILLTFEKNIHARIRFIEEFHKIEFYLNFCLYNTDYRNNFFELYRNKYNVK